MTTLRNILIGAAGIAAAAFATTASAQNTASESVAVNAKVIRAIQISPGSALEFGTIVTDSDGGSVVIAPGGGRTLTGLTSAAGATPSAGTFHVTAETGQSFGVSSAFDNATPATGLTLGSVTIGGTCGATTATPTGLISSGTTCDVNVGGTLTVANNATGVVSTTITTTVTYD